MASIEDYRINGNDIMSLDKHPEYDFEIYYVSNRRAGPVAVAEYKGMTAEGGDRDQAVEMLRRQRVQVGL